MLLENSAARKLIYVDQTTQKGCYYDITPTSELPSEPFAFEAETSTHECFIVHYHMPMLREMERDTVIPDSFGRGYIRSGDITHVAISLESITPRLEAIKFRGQWLKSEE